MTFYSRIFIVKKTKLSVVYLKIYYGYWMYKSTRSMVHTTEILEKVFTSAFMNRFRNRINKSFVYFRVYEENIYIQIGSIIFWADSGSYVQSYKPWSLLNLNLLLGSYFKEEHDLDWHFSHCKWLYYYHYHLYEMFMDQRKIKKPKLGVLVGTVNLHFLVISMCINHFFFRRGLRHQTPITINTSVSHSI